MRGDRRFEEAERTLVCMHEAVEPLPQSIIARASLRPLLHGAGDGSLEQLLDALPARGIHPLKGPVRLHR
jgi:hypothetical protein